MIDPAQAVGSRRRGKGAALTSRIADRVDHEFFIQALLLAEKARRVGRHADTGINGDDRHKAFVPVVMTPAIRQHSASRQDPPL